MVHKGKKCTYLNVIVKQSAELVNFIIFTIKLISICNREHGTNLSFGTIYKIYRTIYGMIILTNQTTLENYYETMDLAI